MRLLLCVYRYHYHYYDHHHRHQVAVIIVFYHTFKVCSHLKGKESSLPVFTRLQRKKEKLSLHARTGNCFKMSTWLKIKERKREGE